ncbi:substrate-binding domain-containing protein [Dyadobacter sp. LHD-138]|uniref:substrate-binding domain-containing protein n=1 Tax=Dyadobacter sp. LHD-138 TaxID=3071413 RepID=UPI0027E0B511|nr:substrate-binding domain-containing protein [Dyadobacter sp. LHD-138]MDQ6478259.1 substrate-binding domain-containing protein [Dyadobacter sp. LHD-138]
MKKKIVRIKDIAERAETSKGTVDRVLHNRGRVAEDVREKVLKIIKEMNYEPNFLAQSLKTQKTYSFIALVPDPKTDPYWEFPEHGIAKAEKDLRQYGISITRFIFDPHDVSSFIEKAKDVTREHPDGLLVAPLFYKEVLPFFKEWEALEIPYVLFNTQISNINPLCYIGQDSYQSGFLAAKILSFGLPDACSMLVLHIDEDLPNSAHLITKEEGFKDYFIRKNLTDKYKVLEASLNFSEGESFDHNLDQLLAGEKELRAIYVTNSKAFAIAQYLEKNKLNHIKLVGYDLIPQNLHYLNLGFVDFLINQNPLGQGYWGIYQLANHLVFKKEIPPIKFLPLDIITQENLEYYLDPEQ